MYHVWCEGGKAIGLNFNKTKVLYRLLTPHITAAPCHGGKPTTNCYLGIKQKRFLQEGSCPTNISLETSVSTLVFYGL